VDGAAADVIVTLDGQALGTHAVTALPTSTVGHENPEHTPWSYRIDGALLSAGGHEIRLEYVNVKAWGSFNYWQIEAIQPPLILLPETVSFPGTWDHAPVRSNFNVSEEDRLVIRDLQRAVAREFVDGHVHYVPLQDVVPHDQPIFAPDDLHPNALGHDLIAERLYDYVVAHWTRAHALGTGTALPDEPPSARAVQIQRIRTKVGKARRRIIP
jgi:hypothetical protein